MAYVDVDERIPESARRALSILVDQIEDLELNIESYEKVFSKLRETTRFIAVS